jgi:hypothetical protein
MHIKGLGIGSLFAVAALAGCGSSSGSSGTGGSSGKAGSGGSAQSTGTGGGSVAGHGGGGTAGSSNVGRGGNSGNSTGTFSTSVNSGTKLTALSGAQATQLCTDINSFFDNTLTATLCTAQDPDFGLEAAAAYLEANPSATDAQLQATCAQAAVDGGSCRVTGSVDGGIASCDTASIPSTCQATVGDYATCLNATEAAYVQFIAAIPSCGSLTAASLTAYFATDGGGTVGPTEPSSCATIDATCSTSDGGSDANAATSAFVLPQLTSLAKRH